MDNETWLIEEGDRLIQKKAEQGFDSLTDWERLVYSLWVADYGMRNTGDLGTTSDVFADFQSVGLLAANSLSLPVTRAAFTLTPAELEERYFDLFTAVCNEVRNAVPVAPTDRGGTGGGEPNW